MHRGKFFLSLKPVVSDSEAGKSKERKLRFAERLCFSRAGIGFNGLAYKEGEVVIAANPRNPVVLGDKLLPGSVIGRARVGSAGTRWLGEPMDLSMTIDGLLGASQRKI